MCGEGLGLVNERKLVLKMRVCASATIGRRFGFWGAF